MATFLTAGHKYQAGNCWWTAHSLARMMVVLSLTTFAGAETMQVTMVWLSPSLALKERVELVYWLLLDTATVNLSKDSLRETSPTSQLILPSLPRHSQVTTVSGGATPAGRRVKLAISVQ